MSGVIRSLRGRYTVPEAAAEEIILCRRLRYPLWASGAINEVLAALTEESSWRGRPGGISVLDASQALQDVFTEFLHSEACMIGTIQMLATDELAPHMLPCDGGLYQRAEYPRLYAALHAALIVDADTFMTPNMNGKYPVGAGGLAPFEAVGADNFTLTEAQMPPHTHTTVPHRHTFKPNVTGDLDVEGVGIPQPNAAMIIPLIDNFTAEETVTINSSGGGEPVAWRPPSIPVIFAIVAR